MPRREGRCPKQWIGKILDIAELQMCQQIAYRKTTWTVKSRRCQRTVSWKKVANTCKNAM